MLVRRDTREKYFVPMDALESEIDRLLKELAQSIYRKALENRERRTYVCRSLDEIRQSLAEKGDGFVMAMWCGEEACEDEVKEQTGVGSRCIPFDQKQISDVCVCCGKPAKHMVCWGKAY